MATTHAADSDSDYGWDLSAEDEQQLMSIAPAAWATTVTASRSNPTTVAPTFAVGEGASTDEFTSSSSRKKGSLDSDPGVSRGHETRGFFSRRARGHGHHGPVLAQDGSAVGSAFPRSLSTSAEDDDVSYPDLSSALSNISPEREVEPKAGPEAQDDMTQPPLVRFRSYPRKPFSVTDLASGAWCELQQEYTLNLLPGGRKVRTAAMKAGTKYHKDLEDEVHTTVRIDIMSKEDAFGLRLWNIVQGLRTLRETDLTRELEVWGLVDGHVVNGLIDELSYEHPDPEFEEILSSQGSKDAAGSQQQQPRITHFFPDTKEASGLPDRKIFLTDIKTRGSMRPPKEPPIIRPAKIQLFLYHRFLSDMAAEKLDFLHVIRRYGLDPDAQFSDVFIAQVGSLHDEIFYDAASVQAVSDTSEQAVPDLIRYRTLRSLLPLLVDEIRLTFSHGAESIGSLVTVKYIYQPRGGSEDGRGAREAGSAVGQNIIPVNNEVLDLYLDRYMEWWRGERAAEGVDIEEASYKCRNCDFVDICTYRTDQDRKRLQTVKAKLASKSEGGPTPVDAGKKTGRRRSKAAEG